jgi:hypothetical protein
MLLRGSAIAHTNALRAHTESLVDMMPAQRNHWRAMR